MCLSNDDLKKAGLKVTLPRLKILELLEKSKKRHVSAEEIYHQLLAQSEDVGLATVYRVLTQFETAGLVTRLRFDGEHSVFELQQSEHHDHLVCVDCGHVAEFVDEVIESRQIEIAKQHDFELTEHEMTLYGLCSTCRGRATK
ncbi:MAG: ferric iron uptake transcriptional regulator [Gammaproteobacteria bacterium]|nr:ferric iron uptake transcriptional regulator [Gammaproteobacteria bacterium]